jgi:HPt (histidine-containing phosphotransfer) domain-containing protein
MSTKPNTNPESNDFLAIPSFDYHHLQHLEGIMGHEMTLLLVQQFLQQLPLQIQALRASIVSHDAGNIRRNAHRFKGESLQIGAIRLGKLCEKIEFLAQQNDLETLFPYLATIETELAQLTLILNSVGNDD